jgi:hypothetical protein
MTIESHAPATRAAGPTETYSELQEGNQPDHRTWRAGLPFQTPTRLADGLGLESDPDLGTETVRPLPD